MRFVVDSKPRGPGFDPRQADYYYQTIIILFQHNTLALTFNKFCCSQDAFFTEIFFSVELTLVLSLTGLLSHLGSNICKTQDHSHSDTTLIYISTYDGTR